MNLVMKRVEDQVKGMKEERGRVVMELEREEEGRVRELMGRLERERRERLLLERRIYHGDEEESFSGVDRLRCQQQQHQQIPNVFGGFVRQDTPPPPIVTNTRTDLNSSNDNDDTGDTSNTISSAAARPVSTNASSDDVAFQSVEESNNNNGIQEDVEEEEEEDVDDEEEESFNEDILGGYQHDAEMEEELEKMLKLKEEKKE